MQSIVLTWQSGGLIGGIDHSPSKLFLIAAPALRWVSSQRQVGALVQQQLGIVPTGLHAGHGSRCTMQFD
jgi:hypothetical protein